MGAVLLPKPQNGIRTCSTLNSQDGCSGGKPCQIWKSESPLEVDAAIKRFYASSHSHKNASFSRCPIFEHAPQHERL
jgi:hypothetical protein